MRERVAITLRPIGAPTSIGFFGLAAATFCVGGLQLGWVDVGEGKKVALVLIGFNLGYMSAGPLAAWLIAHLGWRPAYALLGGGCAALTLLAAASVRLPRAANNYA